MKDKERSVFKDLLSLYHEGLLSKESAEWIEEAAENDEELQKLLKMTEAELPKEHIESTVHESQMFKKINRKLSLYQLMFTAISFFLAIHTSLLNESFGFILWYAVLGLAVYLFYRDMKLVILLSFAPIFIWGMGIFWPAGMQPTVQGLWSTCCILSLALSCLLLFTVFSPRPG